MAVSSYRSLLRSFRVVFQGDRYALATATQAARQKFEENALAPQGQLPTLLAEAEDARLFLLNNVVQGKLNDDNGIVEAKIEARHTTDSTSPTSVVDVRDVVEQDGSLKPEPKGSRCTK